MMRKRASCRRRGAFRRASVGAPYGPPRFSALLHQSPDEPAIDQAVIIVVMIPVF